MAFKIVNICPIHEKKSKSDKANYRPVGMGEHAGKVFERKVAKAVIKVAITNRIIPPEQAAFLAVPRTRNCQW